MVKLFYTTKVLDTTVSDIMKVIEENNLKKVLENTCTVKGFQSDNLLHLFSKKMLQEILPVSNLVEKIFHIHFIEYEKGGKQKEHNHKNTEEYSFILYLNNSDGCTVFKEPINKKISPKKGLLVIFSSDINHYALESFKNKKVLVGAIQQKEIYG
tara:strand:- start:20 stop:484 length:465 start_codon:yes stop_codon:yes gene_type:complete